MVRKLLLLGLWFPVTGILLLVNLYFLTTIARNVGELEAQSAYQPLQITAAGNHGSGQLLGATVYAADARALLLQDFLNRHQSPLAAYANLIVEQADKQRINFRLLPSIAMCESNLGKRVPLKRGFNPFGIAVYTGQLKGKNFDSWEHGIRWVSEYIKTRYYDRGLTELVDIGAVWAPPSTENGDSWANCVKFFMDQIQ